MSSVQSENMLIVIEMDFNSRFGIEMNCLEFDRISSPHNRQRIKIACGELNKTDKEFAHYKYLDTWT